MSSIYLYCFAELAAIALVEKITVQDDVGIDPGTPLFTLERAGIVAVTGEVNPAEFSEQNLQSMEWIAPRAYRHAALVARAMTVSPVMPVKFGTLFESQERLAKLLIQHHERIRTSLDKLRDKAEWGVKVFLDEESARVNVRAQDAHIQARIAMLPGAPGARYLQQKQLDVMVEAALKVWVTRRIEGIGDALSALVEESVQLRLLSPKASGRKQRMIFNASYLVRNDSAPEFCKTLENLTEQGRELGLDIELSGPWPAYNFCPDLRVES